MNLQETLSQLNLHRKATRVYLAALELGTATAKEIAKKAEIKRTTFYDASSKLLEIGLLKQSRRGKRRLFTAAQPEELLALQEQKLEQIKKALPQLRALHNTTGQKPKVFHYEGESGIDKINHDTLLYKGEVIVFTTPRFYAETQLEKYEEYTKKRKAIGNKIRVIGEMDPQILKRKKKDKEDLAETRILPKEIFSSEVDFGAYNSKVFIVNYKEKFGFVIEDTEIAKTFEKIFEIIWNSGRVIE